MVNTLLLTTPSQLLTWQSLELDSQQFLHPLPDEEARCVGDLLLAAGQGVAAAARLGGDVGGHGGVQLQPLPEPRVAVAAVTAGAQPGRLKCIKTVGWKPQFPTGGPQCTVGAGRTL